MHTIVPMPSNLVCWTVSSYLTHLAAQSPHPTRWSRCLDCHLNGTWLAVRAQTPSQLPATVENHPPKICSSAILMLPSAKRHFARLLAKIVAQKLQSVPLQNSDCWTDYQRSRFVSPQPNSTHRQVDSPATSNRLVQIIDRQSRCWLTRLAAICCCKKMG